MAAELVHRETERLRSGLEDDAGCDLARLVASDEIAKDALGHGQVDGLPVQAGVRRDADEGALELADVVGDVGRDVAEHLVRDIGSLPLRLLTEDREPGLELGRLDVGDQTPLEAVAEPVLERGDGSRRTIGGDNDLAAGSVEGVKRVEELLLEALLVLDELHVIDE